MIIDNGFSIKLIMLLMCLIVVLLSCTINAPKPADDDNSTTIEKEAESETENENTTETSGGLPPLVIDTSAPLLLDEPSEEERAFAVAATEAAKDNAACFVCHANYKTEFLANRHARVNIGCFNCHGESAAHQNDENNITPPESLYPAEKIEPFCRKCHQSHDVSPKEVITRWKERGLDKTDLEKMVCTDCHGDHRMKVRTIIWDKKTGELLSTNKGD